MHELGITQNIVAIACENAQGAQISKISLEVGQLTTIMPDAVRFCFDVCARDTLCQGATLEIIEVPGKAKCRQCRAEFALDMPYGICECGSTSLDIIDGEQLKIQSMEVASCA